MQLIIISVLNRNLTTLSSQKLPTAPGAAHPEHPGPSEMLHFHAHLLHSEHKTFGFTKSLTPKLKEQFQDQQTRKQPTL